MYYKVKITDGNNTKIYSVVNWNEIIKERLLLNFYKISNNHKKISFEILKKSNNFDEIFC